MAGGRELLLGAIFHGRWRYFRYSPISCDFRSSSAATWDFSRFNSRLMRLSLREELEGSMRSETYAQILAHRFWRTDSGAQILEYGRQMTQVQLEEFFKTLESGWGALRASSWWTLS